MNSISRKLWQSVQLRSRSVTAVALAFVFGIALCTNYITALAAPSPAANSTYDPVRSCSSLTATPITENTDNVTYAVQEAIADPGTASQPASCQVRVTSTHPPAGDTVNIWIWLPASDWNGRFMGTGGSGFSGGSVNNLASPLSQGYVAGATDTGHPGNSGSYIT